MIRIAISPAAYAAISATLAGSVGVEPQHAPYGDYLVWLDPAVVNRLAAMRGSGESHGDAILRLAKGARLQVGEGQGKIKASLSLETSDPEVAQQMATVGQGLLALLKLQKDNPGSLKIAEALSLKQDGAGVVASLAIPTGEVVELIRADAARKAQKQAEKE